MNRADLKAGIPPDPYPRGVQGYTYAGRTSFDRQSGGANVRYAEIRGAEGLDVVSISITVIAPEGAPLVPLSHVALGTANPGEPQIVAGIKTPDGSALADGYVCQFAFTSVIREAGC